MYSRPKTSRRRGWVGGQRHVSPLPLCWPTAAIQQRRGDHGYRLGRRFAVQDQIDATIKDSIQRARSKLPRGSGLTHCEQCEVAIPPARRQAVPGVRLCVSCQSAPQPPTESSSCRRQHTFGTGVPVCAVGRGPYRRSAPQQSHRAWRSETRRSYPFGSVPVPRTGPENSTVGERDPDPERVHQGV